jgi:hypothetical protein
VNQRQEEHEDKREIDGIRNASVVLRGSSSSAKSEKFLKMRVRKLTQKLTDFDYSQDTHSKQQIQVS